MTEVEKKLSSTEELDFHYLLTLMGTVYDIPQYSWLPELFSIIGHERLIKLCKYAGGEEITIPTLEELSDAVEAMQWYYDVYIKQEKTAGEVPAHYRKLVARIQQSMSSED